MVGGRAGASPTLICLGATGLISIDASGPTAADVPQDAWLGDAPHLQALAEPTPRLDLAPRHILQRDRPATWRSRLRGGARCGGAAVLVHVAFAAAFFYLLSFRDVETPREIEIPLDFRILPAEPEAPKPAAKPAAAQRDGTAAGSVQTPGAPAGGPQVDPTKPVSAGGPQADPAKPPTAAAQEAAPAPSNPKPPRAEPPPAPPTPPKPAPEPASPARPQAGGGPKLVAAPEDTAHAATQDRENKTANLAPDEHERDQATREAKPVAVPQTLTTSDPRAAFAVPVPVAPKAAVVDKPAPPIPAKTRSAADQLAAALPMDTSAMPSSFRAVLSGNGAQVKAIYSGVVQGRLAQAQPEIVDAAYSQQLKGSVAVTFTVDDTGHLSALSIVQSSGDPKLDALALHWIQTAAPFPPPPPEADHTFRKALFFGN